jgi:multiple sugar transport system substrate-binding protein
MTGRHRPLSRRGFIALGGAAGLALTGCSSGGPRVDAGPPVPESGYDGPPVELSYWTGFTGGDGPTMRAIVDSFNSSQDLITVEMNTVQWAQYYQRVAAATHAGRGPDIGAMQIDQIATQAERQTLNPLDDVLTDLGVTADDYPPEVWDRGSYRDARYGVPLDVHSLATYSNTGLLREAGLGEVPTDGDEYVAYLAEAVAAGVQEPFWMPNRWPAHLMFLSLLWQFGGEPYAEDGTAATFDSDAGVQALEWMVSTVDQGFSPPNVAVDSQYTAFKDGRGAVTWDGIWQINDLKTTAPDLEWAMSPVPSVGPDPAVWASSHQLVLFRQRSPEDYRLQAGKAFIRYVVENSQAWAAAGMIPAAAQAREEPEFLDSTQAAIAEVVPTMRFLPPVPALGDVQVQTLELAVSDAVLGRTPPAEALSGAAATATTLMQANLAKFSRGRS